MEYNRTIRFHIEYTTRQFHHRCVGYNTQWLTCLYSYGTIVNGRVESTCSARTKGEVEYNYKNSITYLYYLLLVLLFAGTTVM